MTAKPCLIALSRNALLAVPAGLLLCCYALAPSAADADERDRPRPAATQQEYDEVIAQVPREQAPIAAVALAKVTIALHSAKQQAENRLCPGQWTPSGSLLHQYGPTIASQTSGGEQSEYWFFHSLRVPEAISCEQISRPRFFLEMSRHLPGWITIRPGGQLTAYQQGNVLLAAPEGLMAVR
jgi:hypothetical protein